MKTRKELFECDACNCHGFTLSAMKAHNKTAEHIKLTYDRMYVPKPQHTPGPWKKGINIPDRCMDIYTEEVLIAKVPSNRNQTQCEVNAHLIAAAPELLEAAKNALGLIDRSEYANGEVQTLLESAIAKAEGK